MNAHVNVCMRAHVWVYMWRCHVHVRVYTGGDVGKVSEFVHLCVLGRLVDRLTCDRGGGSSVPDTTLRNL